MGGKKKKKKKRKKLSVLKRAVLLRNPENPTTSPKLSSLNASHPFQKFFIFKMLHSIFARTFS